MHSPFGTQAWRKPDVYQLLESEAHHHKISPVGTGRLIAMVGTTDAVNQDARNLQILFGLVLTITPRTTKNKNELPAARIHRQCNPKQLKQPSSPSLPLNSLQKSSFRCYKIGTSSGVRDLNPSMQRSAMTEAPSPPTFFLQDMWMFGCTKPTSEVTAVAQTPLCRYQLGYNVQTAVDGMDGGWTLRGWVRQQCIVIATFCCLLGNDVARMSHVSGWLLIRLLQGFEFIATQWVFTTVSLANLLWLFLLGLAPFAVCFAVFWMVRRKSGWGICVLRCVFGLCFGCYDLPSCMRPPASM